MKLTLKSNLGEFDKQIKKMEAQLQRETQEAAEAVSQNALLRMRHYLQVFIYDNPESEWYARTQHALDSLGVNLTRTPRGFMLTLRNEADYASQLEQGNELDYFQERSAGGGHEPLIGAEELLDLLAGIAEENHGESEPELVSVRRGPVDYQQPAPHVTPAAITAVYEFKDLLTHIWRQFEK